MRCLRHLYTVSGCRASLSTRIKPPRAATLLRSSRVTKRTFAIRAVALLAHVRQRPWSKQIFPCKHGKICLFRDRALYAQMV